MTYLFYVILNAVKNPTEELTGRILFTLVVGYFANAQYDALIFHFTFFISTAEYAINFYKNFSYRR